MQEALSALTKVLQCSRILFSHILAIPNIAHKLMLINRAGVHGVKGLPAFGGAVGDQGLEVQGSFLVPGLHLEYVFTRKAPSCQA